MKVGGLRRLQRDRQARFQRLQIKDVSRYGAADAVLSCVCFLRNACLTDVSSRGDLRLKGRQLGGWCDAVCRNLLQGWTTGYQINVQLLVVFTFISE